MKHALKWMPFILAAAWLLLRFITAKFFVDFDYPQGRTFGVFSNLLCILILVFTGLISLYRRPPGEASSFGKDLKASLKSVMKYVVSVVLMMWLYYGVISSELSVHAQNNINQIGQLIDTEEELAAVKAQNPLLQNESRENIEKGMVERIEFFTSLKVLLPASLIALSLTAVVYALLGVWVWRRFVVRV